MKMYHLEPIDEHLQDEAWTMTRVKEGCWILAGSEEDARRQVEQVTRKFVDREEGKATPYSPWLDSKLATCLQAEAPFEVPEGTLVTDGGKTLS